MQIRFDEARWSIDHTGAWLSLKIGSVKEAEAFIGEEMQPGKPYVAELKPFRKKRSLDANAYCWVLIDKLAQKLRLSKERIYRAAIKEIGGNSATVCVADKAVEKLRAGWEGNGLGWITDTMESKLPGCTNLVLYYGSSTYDTDQMSRLVELIVQECKQQGIETATPMKLAALMEGWHEKHTAGR